MKSLLYILTLIIIQSCYVSHLFSFVGYMFKTKKEHRELGEQLFAAINKYRAQNGLPQVKWDDHVYYKTIDHSEYQRNRETMSHNNVKKRVAKYAEGVENVGYTRGHKITDVVKQIFNGWLNSRGHEKNMSYNFKKKNSHGGKADVYGAVGVISNKDDSLMYATMVFVTKSDKSPTGHASKGCF